MAKKPAAKKPPVKQKPKPAAPKQQPKKQQAPRQVVAPRTAKPPTRPAPVTSKQRQEQQKARQEEAQRVREEASEEAVSGVLFGSYAQDIFDIDPSIRGAYNQIIEGIRNGTIKLRTKAGQDVAMGILKRADWSQRFGATARDFLIKEKTDPGETSVLIKRRADELRESLREIGGTATEQEIMDMARISLMGGRLVNGVFEPLTADETRRWLTRTVNFDGTLRGPIRQTQNSIRDLAFNYGFTDLMGGQMNNWLRDTTKAITENRLTIDDVEDQMRNFAIGRFPALSKQLQAGIPLSDLVAPYKNTLANMLELDESSIRLGDSLMEKALGALGPDGQQSLMPLWEFKQQIRNDPRWLSTDQAVGTYNNIGVQIAKDFGFI
jgi:hypothetical protein